MFLKANAKFIHAKNSVDVASAKIDSREVTGKAQFVKINSRDVRKKYSQKLIPAKISSLKVSRVHAKISSFCKK